MASTIADRIRILMHFKKLTATQFAEIINVQRSSVSHVLSGRNKPSLDFIQKIVNEFPEVNFEWLINGKGSFKKNTNVTPSGPAIDTNVKPLVSSNVTPVTNPISKPLLKTDTTVNKEISNPPTSGETKPTKKLPSTPVIKEKSNNKTIERIVVFYTDGTFENYSPNNNIKD